MGLFYVPRRELIRGALGAGIVRSQSNVATQFAVSVTPTAGKLGFVSKVTFTPARDAWPANTVLTLVATNIVGVFGSVRLRPIGSTPISTTFTALTPGPGHVNATASTAIVSAGAAAVEVTSNNSWAVVQSVSGLPTNGVAFNPLAQGMLIYSNIALAYACLYYNLADEGLRKAFGGGQLPPLTPQAAVGGSYKIRVYDAARGGNCFFESPPINVGANPSHIGGSLTFRLTSPGAWRKSTPNHGNLLNNDTYITADGPMTDASIYASKSDSIPPDQPGENVSIVGSRSHIVDANRTRLYVSNLYVNGTGLIYIWIIAVSAIDGTTTRSRLSSVLVF